jgi:hypothetical protein
VAGATTFLEARRVLFVRRDLEENTRDTVFLILLPTLRTALRTRFKVERFFAVLFLRGFEEPALEMGGGSVVLGGAIALGGAITFVGAALGGAIALGGATIEGGAPGGGIIGGGELSAPPRPKNLLTRFVKPRITFFSLLKRFFILYYTREK